jgi:tetratricopeptide (TPR) repeat protein
MRKVLVTIVLALTASLVMGQGTSPNQKIIKDPTEYDAYIKALNTQDPTAKAAAMEAFVKQYPQSIVLADALDQAMAAYQAAGNQAKVVETAKHSLALNPNNVRALAIVTAIDRQLAIGGGAGGAAALQEGCASAQTGLQQLPGWQKPEGTSDDDFKKLTTQISDIFNGAAGFCALQSKDYSRAQSYYEQAFAIDPTNLQDVYQLAISYLEVNPIDLKGLWYAAKAINVAGNNAAAVNGISAYAKSKYKKYHGSYDGWDQLVATAATQSAPPADMAALVTPKPTDCDIAASAVAQNDPGTLSFSDWEFVLSQRDCAAKGKDAADKVWQAIQGKQKGGEAKLRIPETKVIASTKDSVDVAITDENKTANKADLHVVMDKPVLHPPAPGSNTDVIGVLTSYTPSPFLFTMEKGELPEVEKPKAPVHRPAARKKAAQ